MWVGWLMGRSWFCRFRCVPARYKKSGDKNLIFEGFLERCWCLNAVAKTWHVCWTRPSRVETVPELIIYEMHVSNISFISLKVFVQRSVLGARRVFQVGKMDNNTDDVQRDNFSQNNERHFSINWRTSKNLWLFLMVLVAVGVLVVV